MAKASAEKLPAVGTIVTVRDRTRPAGLQVFPGIVEKVNGNGTVDVTGFSSGVTVHQPAVAEIDPASEDTRGFYA